MEPMLVLIGLFLLVAMLQNKDLSESKENKEVFTFLSFLVILLVLCGIGFIMPSSMSIRPNTSFLILFLPMCAITTAYSNGNIKVFSRIAWVAILYFIMLGQFA